MSSRPQFRFRLYVAGASANSSQALTNLRGLCQQCLPGEHEIEVVDVLQEPARALRERVLVTPTLVKLAPRPEARLIGNLSRTELVRQTLGLPPGIA